MSFGCNENVISHKCLELRGRFRKLLMDYKLLTCLWHFAFKLNALRLVSEQWVKAKDVTSSYCTTWQETPIAPGAGNKRALGWFSTWRLREEPTRTCTQREDRRLCPHHKVACRSSKESINEGEEMIYLAVRLAPNSAAAAGGFSKPGESNQFWLHPSASSNGEGESRLPDELLDDSRVQWFRSPKIAYVLRDF